MKRKPLDTRATVYASLIFLFLAMGYGTDELFGPWKFAVSTALIFFLTRMFYPKDYGALLGLRGIRWFHIPGFLILMVFFFGLSYWIIQNHLAKSGLTLKYMSREDLICPPFQTLNEEWVFRSLLLRLFSPGSCLLPAGIFAWFHDIFYRFNYLPENQGQLSWLALGTLFCFGYTLNLIWHKTHNILWVWGIHLGWNLNQFGFRIVSLLTEKTVHLKEWEVFNLLAGSPGIFLLSFVCLFCVKQLFLPEYVETENLIGES
jgi:hypothetical protein